MIKAYTQETDRFHINIFHAHPRKVPEPLEHGLVSETILTPLLVSTVLLCSKEFKLDWTRDKVCMRGQQAMAKWLGYLEGESPA